MLIYNVTVNIDEEVHQEWLNWMKTNHIPSTMNSGCFLEHKMCKVLSTQEDETGHTYAIQYTCNSLDELNSYQEEFAPELNTIHGKRYQGKFVAFSSLMEVV